ncbi:MAG: hypothetical protein JNN15_06045 [Blastocatellia bacterium]|nr:hypothetical protein [Blastocatellia bacterium]
MITRELLSSDELQKSIYDLAKRLAVPPDSYLLAPTDFSDADQIKMRIDGLTLAFISYCYHKHPRGENVYEVMERLEKEKEGSPEASVLEARAEAAAALEIPFIVKLNDLLEDYYIIRFNLEQFISDTNIEDSV